MSDAYETDLDRDTVAGQPRTTLPVMPAGYVFGQHPATEAAPIRDYGQRPEITPPYYDRSHPQGTTAIPPGYRPPTPVMRDRVPQAEQVSGVPVASVEEPTKPSVSPLAVLPQEMQQVLKAVAQPESGGNPNVLYGGDDMRKYPDRPGYKGFPDWPGKMGPQGISHAAGELQWQPDTWLAAANALGLDNFRDPVQRAKAGSWLAAKTYKDKTGRDIISDQKAGVDVVGVLHTQGSPWASQSPMDEVRYNWAQDDRSTYEKGVGESQAAADRYRKVADAAPAGSAERATALREAREALRGAREKFDALTKIPPIYKPTEPMEQFGSMAVILAGLGGLFARQHMTAAMGAAGEAMQAHNQQNYDRFKIASDQWKTQLDMGLTSVKLAGDEIKAVLEDDKIAYDEKQARLNQIHTEYQMSHQTVEDAARHQEARERAAERMQIAKERMEQQRFMIMFGLQNKGFQLLSDPNNKDENGKDTQYLFNPNTQEARTLTGEPYTPKGAEKVGAGGLTQSKGREADIEADIAAKDKAWLAAPENAEQKTVPSDVHFNHRLEAEEKLKTATTQQRSMPAIFVQDYKKNHPGSTTEEAYRVFRREGAIESSFGGGMAGRNLTALNTVADHLTLLKEYATALKNKDIPLANRILNQFSVQTGHSEVTNYRLARDVAADEIVRLLTSTGGTAEDRSGMKANFDAAGSPEQLLENGAIDVAGRFVAGRFHALAQQYAGNDPELRRHFEQEMLTPEARKWFASDRPASPGSVVVPVPAGHQTDADGTTYSGSDGKTYIKRGNQMVPK